MGAGGGGGGGGSSYAQAAGAGLAVGGMIGQHFAGANEAEALGNVAKARQARAEEERQQAINAAEPSANELAVMSKQLAVTDRSIARQESLLEALDPALKEAGNQALQMMQGKEAGTLDPMRRQQARQRATLENSLREQLGSGYATSSAGIEALSRFDEQAAGGIAQAQQSALGQMLGATLNARSQVHPESFGAMYNPSVAAEQNVSNRRLQARLGTSTVAQAGGQYAEDAYKSANTKATFAGVSALGGTLMGAGGGGSADKTPTDFSKYDGMGGG